MTQATDFERLKDVDVLKSVRTIVEDLENCLTVVDCFLGYTFHSMRSSSNYSGDSMAISRGGGNGPAVNAELEGDTKLKQCYQTEALKSNLTIDDRGCLPFTLLFFTFPLKNFIRCNMIKVLINNYTENTLKLSGSKI